MDASGYIPPVALADTELKDPNNMPIYAWYHPVTGECSYVQHDGHPIQLVPVRGFDGEPILDENGQPAMTLPTKPIDELKCDSCGSINVEVKAELTCGEIVCLVVMCVLLLWPCVIFMVCAGARQTSNAYCKDCSHMATLP